MVHHPPGRWNHGEALTLLAQLDAVYSKPMVHYRGAGQGRFITVPMEKMSAGVFEVAIPAAHVVAPRIRYYISALDENGNRHPVFARAMGPHRVKIVRGRLLDGTKKRNHVFVDYRYIDRGASGDISRRLDLRYERAFFPFLVSRIGFLRWEEGALAKPAVGGEAGLELRMKGYLSLTADLQTIAYGAGSAFGYRFGLRVGDEVGASIGGSYGYTFDLSDNAPVGEALSFSLSVPLRKRLQFAGIFQSDNFFRPGADDLKLLARLTGRFISMLQISGTGGIATRGGDQTGVYFGAALGLVF
jgi:hypothetical protein